jgi:hypothetical protein
MQINNPLLYDIRKVQNSRGCLMISIPAKFARWLGLTPGVPMKIQFDSDENFGNRIIISKVYIDNTDDNDRSEDR